MHLPNENCTLRSIPHKDMRDGLLQHKPEILNVDFQEKHLRQRAHENFEKRPSFGQICCERENGDDPEKGIPQFNVNLLGSHPAVTATRPSPQHRCRAKGGPTGTVNRLEVGEGLIVPRMAQ